MEQSNNNSQNIDNIIEENTNNLKNGITEKSDKKSVENNDKQATHTAEAEENSGEKGSLNRYGKFKDADSLKKAYESLEAEFTKKCQKLSLLQSQSTNGKDNDKPEPPQFDYSDNAFIEKNILTNKAIVDRVIFEYLKELTKTNSPKTLNQTTGVTPLSNIKKPKTIAEAGMMAEKMIKGIK